MILNQHSQVRLFFSDVAEELTKYGDTEVKLRLYTGWENGEGVPSPENLIKIVAVLGLTQDEEEMLYHAAARVPPKIRHLPFSPNPFFTGRKSYLRQLRQFLQENGTLALTQPVSISGLGGIGKTQLALAYAYLSYSKVYRVVLWLNAADETTLQADYDTLARKLRHPLATEILNFCAFLQPDAIPEELFQHDDSFMPDALAFKAGIASLQRYSLIKLNSKEMTFSMHRLVQAVLIDNMPPDLQKQWRDRVVQALNAAFPEPDFKQWVRCERLLSHVLACAAWLEYELTPTVGVARLYHATSIYLCKRGQYSVVEVLLDQVLSIYVRHLGVEHLIIAYARNDLAILYQLQGKYLSAEALYHLALAIFENQLGAEHPDIAMSLYNLAFLYMEQGKYERAVPLVVRVLSIQKKHLPAGHPDTVRSLEMLAVLSRYKGKYERAEFLYRQTLRILDKHLEAEHPDIARTLHNLAILMEDQGKHEQADSLYQQALNIQERQLGAEHPYTQDTRKDYATFLLSIGRDAEAAALAASDEPSVQHI